MPGDSGNSSWSWDAFTKERLSLTSQILRFQSLQRVLASAPSPFLRCETRMWAVQLCAETHSGSELALPGLHPHFKGSAYHPAESLLPAPHAFLWKVLPADPEPQVSSLTWIRQGGRESMHLLVFAYFKRLLQNVQSKTHPQEQSPLLLLPHNIFHWGNSPEDLSLCSTVFHRYLYKWHEFANTKVHKVCKLI